MSRGIDGIDIFRDDTDREQFLAYLQRALTTTESRCYAWCLMSNHYHVLVRPGEGRLSRLFRQHNTAYATYFNRRHERRGYLYQDRFKSVASQETRFFRELVGYIHLNPVRAGLVSSLDELDHFPWCSHAVVTGSRACTWLSRDEVLQRFGHSRREALQAYRNFLREKFDGGSETLEGQVGAGALLPRQGKVSEASADDRVMGDAEFVAGALRRERQRVSQCVRFRRDGWTIERIEQRISATCGIPVGEIRSRSKARLPSLARGLVALYSHENLGESYCSVGRYYGMTGPSMIFAARRAREHCRAKQLTIDF